MAEQTQLPTDVIHQLSQITGDTTAVLTEESERWAYGYDNSRRQALLMRWSFHLPISKSWISLACVTT